MTTKEPTPVQQILLMGETAQEGEPDMIVASIREQLAAYVAIPGLTESAKRAVGRYAGRIAARVRRGELPAPGGA